MLFVAYAKSEILYLTLTLRALKVTALSVVMAVPS